MNNLNPVPFQFSAAIDADYLYSLYENDYLYIQEIFGTAIRHYDEDMNSIVASYTAGDMEGLKRSIHKIKPSFGFIGMPAMQQQCKDFEDSCVKATSVQEIATDYSKLLNDLVVCKQILEADYQKLLVYNQSL